MIRRLTKPAPTSRSVSRPTTPWDRVRFFFCCRINSWATAIQPLLIAKPPRAMCEPSGIDPTTSATVLTLSTMVFEPGKRPRLSKVDGGLQARSRMKPLLPGECRIVIGGWRFHGLLLLRQVRIGHLILLWLA